MYSRPRTECDFVTFTVDLYRGVCRLEYKKPCLINCLVYVLLSSVFHVPIFKRCFYYSKSKGQPEEAISQTTRGKINKHIIEPQW